MQSALAFRADKLLHSPDDLWPDANQRTVQATKINSLIRLVETKALSIVAKARHQLKRRFAENFSAKRFTALSVDSKVQKIKF